MQGVNHLWNLLLLVQKRHKQKYHLWTWLLLVLKCQTPKHQQQNYQNAKKEIKKSIYQRIRSQTQACQNRCQENMIRLTTANIKAKDTIKGKTIKNRRNMTHQTYRQATLIRPTKAIIKARYVINKRSILKKEQGPIKLFVISPDICYIIYNYWVN